MKKKIRVYLLLLVCFLFIFIRFSKLPKEMPEDFAFSIKWSYDGKYDSSTKILSKGYNYDLQCECKTELELSKEQLQEIYEIIKEARIDNYNETIRTKFSSRSPNSDLQITISFREEKYSVTLLNSYLSDNMNFYLSGRAVGKAIKKIVQKYITSSDEYKSLPENQLEYL
jgi:putative lipoic acid-binding regulatory protein